MAPSDDIAGTRTLLTHGIPASIGVLRLARAAHARPPGANRPRCAAVTLRAMAI